ncbi:MAG: hypothetical protein J6A28_04875 [Clostridia bacterium]|nr:hypothetical protein [Clostridia bacterium]
MFLKEHRHIALHVACGDITDVELDGDKLIVNVFDGTLVKLLADGKRDIENALRWQGLEQKLVINIKETQYSKTDLDLKRLSEVFDKVIIKEFKM